MNKSINGIHTYPEVVELEWLGFVRVEMVPNKYHGSNQYEQQNDSNAHPSLMANRELRDTNSVRGQRS